MSRRQHGAEGRAIAAIDRALTSIEHDKAAMERVCSWMRAKYGKGADVLASAHVTAVAVHECHSCVFSRWYGGDAGIICTHPTTRIGTGDDKTPRKGVAYFCPLKKRTLLITLEEPIAEASK